MMHEDGRFHERVTRAVGLHGVRGSISTQPAIVIRYSSGTPPLLQGHFPVGKRGSSRKILVRLFGWSTVSGKGEEFVGKREHYEPGTFCWLDLTTTDPEAAKAFYGELFGWEAEDTPAGEAGTYTMLRLDGDEVGGLYGMEAERREQGATSYWLSYVSVESADAAAARAGELGGTARGDAFDVMEAGRMAIIADKEGAVLALWEPRDHAGADRVNDVGCMGWNELQTRDPGAAGDFYRELLGWEIEPLEDDGRLVYTTIKNKGSQNGGFMPLAEQHGDAPSFWLPYFTVSSRDDAVEKVQELGGTLLAGPLDLPAGRIAVLADPQGAAFAIFEG